MINILFLFLSQVFAHNVGHFYNLDCNDAFLGTVEQLEIQCKLRHVSDRPKSCDMTTEEYGNFMECRGKAIDRLREKIKKNEPYIIYPID